MDINEKEARSRQLLTEVKAMRDAGINDGETASKAAQMINESSKLAGEVREAKLASKNAELDKLIAEADGRFVGSPDDSTVETKAVNKPAEMYQPGKVKLTPRDISKWGEPLRKAMVEGTNSAGGFLVPPQYAQDLFANVRRQGNVLRAFGLMRTYPVRGQQVLIPKGAGGTTVAWVGEGATKPSADQTYSQLTVNIFKAAGIQKQSKELVDDSTPAALEMAATDLASDLANFEETAAWTGSGTAQPRGLLNVTLPTPNVVTQGTNTGLAIADSVLDAIVAVDQAYFAPPTAIIMHPRRWAFLLKTKTTTNAYLFAQPGTFQAPLGFGAGGMAGSGVTSMTVGTRQVAGSLYGVPVVLSSNVPTNLGGGTQDVIFVGAWDELLWLEREDVQVDTTDQAGTAWESNQVWTRIEERFGFTFERRPGAFATVGGAGLVP